MKIVISEEQLKTLVHLIKEDDGQKIKQGTEIRPGNSAGWMGHGTRGGNETR